MADGEQHSWKKFFLGFVTGRNYLKALVMMFCSFVILVVFSSVWYQVKTRFLTPKATHTQTEKIDQNSGTINQADSHSTTSIVHNHSPLENGLLGLIFGAKDQTVKEGDN